MAENPSLADADWSACESVIRRFEDAWRGTTRPDLGSFLTDRSAQPQRLLAELVHVDLEFRARAGDFVRVEEYLDRYPDLAARDAVLDLITAEFALRNRHSPPAWPEEYYLRFPLFLKDLLGLFAGRGPGSTLPANPSARRRVVAGVPVVPGYVVESEIGRGGMGAVYKAMDLALGRMVALKTLGFVAGGEWAARFRREAEAIARLDHPHIVPVYEVGEWSPPTGPPVPYYVMKYYRGGSLEAAPAGPGTDPAVHARAVETIARAVHHAHQRGVLHRDLKPSNILLDEAGLPHVADFGLAARIDPAAPRPLSEQVVGTPAFMAPEQAVAPATVTTAADVYGLGAILYERLTGQAPFAADTPLAVLDRVRRAPPARPVLVNPRVPRDLETVVLKCLAKEAADRYESAAALADDLARWRTGRPILARPAPAWEHAWRWVSRHPVVSLLSVLAAALFAFAIVAEVQNNDRLLEQQAETSRALTEVMEARTGLLNVLYREQRALYLERVASAGRLYELNQLPQAWQLLDQCPSRFRGWEWHYLDSLRRGGPTVLTGHESRVRAAAFLPDGRLVTGDDAGVVRVWDVAGKKPPAAWRVGQWSVRTVSAHPTRNWVVVADRNAVSVRDADTGAKLRDLAGRYQAAFGPTGEWLAIADDRTVRVWAVPSWEEKWAFEVEDGRVTAVAFHPDQRRLVVGTRDGSIRAWDLTSGRPAGAAWARPRAVTGLAYTGGGKVLVEAHEEGVVVADPETGRHRHRVEPTAAGRAFAATGPDPEWVAVAGANAAVVIWDAAGKRPVREFRGHTAAVAALAFSPDGKWLATGGDDQTVRVWDLSRDPRVRVLVRTGDTGGALAVSPDGARVAVGPRFNMNPDAKSVQVLDAADGREVVRFPGAGAVAFHPDSRRVAAGRGLGEVGVWDVAGGTPRWAKPIPGLRDRQVLYVPDGRRVAFSADGRWLAAWSVRGGELQLWGAAEGAGPVVLDMAGEFVHGLEFSPNGQRLAVAGKDAVTVWDVAARTPVARATAGGGAMAVAYSPDGKLLATADRDRVVRLIDSETLEVVRQLVGTPMQVTGVAFSPDGGRLVTGGSDGAVRVWDAESGQELLSLPGVTGPVVGVAWSSKGDRIFALDDAAVRVWEGRGKSK